MIKYRLGLDVGTNSLGWCLLKLNNNIDGSVISMLDWGSRIFDDGREPAKKDIPGDSSAVTRRTARGIRRRYDRIKIRKNRTIKYLAKYGLMPEIQEDRKKLETLDPLKLRSDGATKKLDLYEIGRALFHLQQRRGFKSNRKEARKNNEDKKLQGTKAGIKKLEELIEGKTLGQFLYERKHKGLGTRVRPTIEKNKAVYDFYPTRKMVEDEFNIIWNKQKNYYPEIINDEAYEKIYKAIFFQRPLKPQEVGKCSILSDEDKRMAWAMPSAQRFRIIKEVNNLRVESNNYNNFSKELTPDEKKKVFELLCKQGSATFDSIRKTLKYESGIKFNLESTRESLKGDETAEKMRGSKKKPGGFPHWDELTLEQQDEVIEKLINDNLEDEELKNWLIEKHELTIEQVEMVIQTPLPNGYARFGKKVISAILPKMIDNNMLEDKAIKECGWKHSGHYTGEICEKLPYYAELEEIRKHVLPMPKSSDPKVAKFGRVGNPTVHIALNQIRRLMNKLKDTYGKWPDEIVIEMSRDLKKGQKEISDIIKEIGKNEEKRKKWKEEIVKIKQNATYLDYAKMKLWEELSKEPQYRKCIYTGKQIDINQLLSDEVEIEHILPYSQTLDDSSANKIVSFRYANRIKGNYTPYEAFKNRTDEMNYNDIWERAQILKDSKKWRFLPNAMEIFEGKAKKIIMKSSLGDIEINTELEGFAARQLVDTSYIAKLAKKYLAYACHNGEAGVTATTGTLTGLLRKSWGLNDLFKGENVTEEDSKKDRNDHRHHAVDALVIAMTTRSMVKKVADASKKEKETGIRLVKHIPKPWPDFEWSELKHRLDKIIVSHKPDHGTTAQIKSTGGNGTSGKLHEDSYYGYVMEKNNGSIILCKKEPLISLIKDNQKHLKLSKAIFNLSSIRDAYLRKEVIKKIPLQFELQKELIEYSDEINGWLTGKIEIKDKVKKNRKKEIEKILDGYTEFYNAEEYEKILYSLKVQYGKKEVPVKTVRTLIEKSRDVMVTPVKRKPETHKKETPYKLMQGGSNHRAEIYMPKSGKNAGKWQMEVIKTFDANKTGFIPKWKNEFPDAELVMKLHINDIIAYEENGQTRIGRIRKISAPDKIVLVNLNRAKLDNDEGWVASANQLCLKNGRKIFVDIDGSVYDPLGILTTVKQDKLKLAYR